LHCVATSALVRLINNFCRAKRALQEMELKADKIMKFKEFAEINERFPALLFPAFRFQKQLRDHVSCITAHYRTTAEISLLSCLIANAFVQTMGMDWWVEKLKRYKDVSRHKPCIALSWLLLVFDFGTLSAL
jgi:hypothetical protein